MADLLLLGLFDNIETTADVVDEVRALGVKENQIEIMSNVPYPAKLFGRKPNRLWFLPFVFGGATVGLLLAAFVTLRTPGIYPIYVSVQGLRPVPPTAIIFFELISLFTMLGMFLGFLLQNRFPILVRQMYDERITDGYIGVQVRAASGVAERVAGIFEAHHAHVVKREDAAEYKSQGIRHLVFWGGVGTAGAVALLVPLLLSYDVVHLPWFNGMAETIDVGHQEGPRRAAPAEAIPVQGPVLIADQPASSPLPATETSIQRGETLFGINCAICHGWDAQKTGSTVGRYFPEAPSMFEARVQDRTPQHIFLVITKGQNRMPALAENLTPGETWDIVNYVQSLGTTGAGQ